MQKQNNEKRVVIYCRESRDDYGENYERIETQRDFFVMDNVKAISTNKVTLENDLKKSKQILDKLQKQ